VRTVSGSRVRSIGVVLAATAIFAAFGGGSALANVDLVKVSSDPFTNASSYHRTQVEPDTFAWGSTIVAVFQTGRFSDGGSSDVGWATSTDAGATWTHGFLPGVTVYSNPAGPFDRDTDPAVAYDPEHDVWLAQTLGMSGTSGAAVIVNRSTDGGLTWSKPVTILNQFGADKNWIVCDTWESSPHYGNCYAEWDNNGAGTLLQMSTSTDGGKTWKLASTPQVSVIGGQPLVQPDGTVIVPTDNGFEGSVESFRSTDGGATYTGPVTISAISNAGDPGSMRTPPLPSAEMDGGGKVYVTWADCRFRSGCSSNDIVMATSKDGLTWSPVTRIPIDGVNSGVAHFIPGIGVDVATKGKNAHLALTYYYFPDSNCSVATCQLDVGFVSSTDGGATWSSPVKLAGPMNIAGLPQTNQGYMVGDYISTSILGGKAWTVFAKSKGSSCTLGQITSCNQKMVAPASGLAVTGGHIPVGRERPLAIGFGRATGGLKTAS
jgi:hypothetical protein